MAAPFVPVPFPVCRSWTRRGPSIPEVSSINCEPSRPETISWVRGVGLLGAKLVTQAPDDFRGPKRCVLDGSSTLAEDEGTIGHRWVEGCIAPTLLGYEILEERAKFTVYKILVTEPHGGSWVIFRRYTDFCRLKDKLKERFPSFDPALPPKRWFKDNYDKEFLKQRQIGLQVFLQNLISDKDILSSDPVKLFLCLVDRPSPYDSLEESRAVCEILEEKYHRLQRELLENQREVDALQKILEEKENYIRLLMKKVKPMSLVSESFKSSCWRTAFTGADTNSHRGHTEVSGQVQQHTEERQM